MTVAELIEKLKTLPPESDVYLWNDELNSPSLFEEKEIRYTELKLGGTKIKGVLIE